MNLSELLVAASKRDAEDAIFDALVAAGRERPGEFQGALRQILTPSAFNAAFDLYRAAISRRSPAGRGFILAMIQSQERGVISTLSDVYVVASLFNDDPEFVHDFFLAMERAGAWDKLVAGVRYRVHQSLEIAAEDEGDPHPHPDPRPHAKFLLDDMSRLPPAFAQHALRALKDFPRPQGDWSAAVVNQVVEIVEGEAGKSLA